MQTVEEIYASSIRLLPENEQRKLASMILEKVGKKRKVGHNGEKHKIYGLWHGKEITKEEYQKLDHNDRIDFDLGNAYACNHEVIMRERGITEALTTDRHFEQEGFVRLLR